VLESITPGQQVIKRIHDELVRLLGGSQQRMDLSERPTGVLLLGLHGSGKTTTAAKLAAQWQREGRRPLLAACDLRRPAAVEQLRVLAARIPAAFAAPQPGDTVAGAARRALETARSQGHDIVLYDTGGRFQIDEELVAELKEAVEAVQPRHRVLVLDAAIGQESVRVAETFHRAVDITGIILTKLDGDARGGAALAVVSVTGRPILYAGIGEKPEDLVPFHPERMASRILGMGDIISLVEQAEAAMDRKAAEAFEQKVAAKQLTLEDLLVQIRQLRKMGPMDRLLEMLPGAPLLKGSANGDAGEDPDRHMRRLEAMILSMTPMERRHPELIDGKRRARIARGSGTTVADVNALLRQFDMMKQMMHAMQQKRGWFARMAVPSARPTSRKARRHRSSR